MSKTVLSALEGGVRTITLNRPERLNAINEQLVHDLRDALREANADTETKVIVLCGAGRAFCAGDDLHEFDSQLGSEEKVRTYLKAIQDITREIIFNEKMVVGAIRGWAAGGGLEWVINCDLTVFGEGTRCFFPETALGVVVTGGVTAQLPQIAGLRRAKELILFGEKFDAKAAKEMGIASRVVPDEKVLEEAQALAARIAALPAVPVRELKRIFSRYGSATIPEMMDMETDACTRGFLDPETAKRARAFTEKKD